ncbi:MAG: twin-arginine translocase TatA/TatE family subunit [Rubrobacter sp.]|jgi:sec-independent protein translocase protein TatA
MSFALIPGIPTLGPTELIIALVVILLLFGAKRIPELARGLGSGVREFKAGTKEGQLEDKKKEEKEKADEQPASEVRADETTLEDDDATVQAEKAEQKRS